MPGAEPSILSFVFDAGPVVKCVLFILLLASIASWTIIVQRTLLLRQYSATVKNFEQQFWSGIDLNHLYKQIGTDDLCGPAAIFHVGLKEFNRLCQQGMSPDAIMEGTQRVMRTVYTQEIEQLERHLPFLATVGSNAPFVGIFGTVWGILTSFRSLGTMQQATIATVAPGISEALIATAFGLFTAIPAIIFYNRLMGSVDHLAHHYEIFQEELTTILHRKAHERDLHDFRPIPTSGAMPGTRSYTEV